MDMPAREFGLRGHVAIANCCAIWIVLLRFGLAGVPKMEQSHKEAQKTQEWGRLWFLPVVFVLSCGLFDYFKLRDLSSNAFRYRVLHDDLDHVFSRR